MSQEFALAPESRIAHYQVEKRIGAGGMGEVYKATDLTLERAVALKILPPSLLGDADRVRRFVQEAKSASALNHPNIVTIYEIGQSPVQPPEGAKGSEQTVHYMAMEFIDGQTLRSMIYGGTPLPELLRILAQAADGLAKAHDAGIVHRDLKPDNIMVTSDGYAKVVDFGLAKLTEQKSGGQKGMTQTGMVMGTVGYMSPEQVEGGVILPPSDIFAFGCIIYECVARRRPFESDLAIDTLHKIMFSEPMPVSAYLGDANPRLQPLIDRCLKKKPGERIGSMRELAAALREISGLVTGPVVAPAAQATVMLGSGGIGAMTPPPSQPQSRPAHPSAGTARPSAELPPPVQPAQPMQAVPLYGRSRRISITGVLSTVYKLALLAVIGVAAWVWLTMPDIAPLRNQNPPAPHWTAYSDFSPSLRRAVVAAIDPDYFDRRALNPKKPQEVIQALTSPERRRYMPSAITKAVAALIYPTAGWNPAGPAKRWAIAASMERTLSRRRILEIYLNLAQFGEASGANQAARRYFRKAPSRLTQDEAVLLSASLFGSPFDPANPSSEIAAAKASILQHLDRVATESAPATDTAKDEPPAKTKRKSRKPATTAAPAPSEPADAPEPSAPPAATTSP